MSQQLQPRNNFPALLEQSKGQIANALPKHMNADRMLRIGLTEFRKNPELQKCDPTSIVKCMVEASQLGLEPGINGEAYLIPYKQECTLVPGYRGLVKNARRHEDVANIDAYPIYEGDEFDIQLGLDPNIIHKPKFKSTKAILYYAFCKLRNGEKIFVVRTREQIEKHRDRYSKQPGGQAWRDAFDEMAIKTVIRSLCKKIPASIELVDTIAHEERGTLDVEVIDTDKRQELLDAPTIPTQNEEEVTQKKFVDLAAKAKELKIDTSTLYQSPEQAMLSFEPKKLHALNVILEQRIGTLSKQEPAKQ